jgi:predicted N-formylglutamate amidohydrolase
MRYSIRPESFHILRFLHIIGMQKTTSMESLTDSLAYAVCNEQGRGRYVIVADHASRRIPESLRNLGLAEPELSRHIAWDIGTEVISRWLAARLDAPAVICGASRLVIDCNRRLTNADLVTPKSDGALIPGNQSLSWSAIGRRIESIYLPYHAAITHELSRARERGIRPVVLSVHSFTPTMNGRTRPWSIGISHTPERRLSGLVLERLRKGGGFLVGDDEPYGAEPDVDYTIFAYGVDLALPHVQVEFRQDLVATPAGAEHWAEVFADAVETAVAELKLA